LPRYGGKPCNLLAAATAAAAAAVCDFLTIRCPHVPELPVGDDWVAAAAHLAKKRQKWLTWPSLPRVLPVSVAGWQRYAEVCLTRCSLGPRGPVRRPDHMFKGPETSLL
jgi:hypothetical protein